MVCKNLNQFIIVTGWLPQYVICCTSNMQIFITLTAYACEHTIDLVIHRLNKELEVTLKLFQSNVMLANPAKCQVIFLGIKDNNLVLNIDVKLVKSSEKIKLLGVILDNKLIFLPHIKDMCAKANNKT